MASDLPYTKAYRSRHGREYLYFRPTPAMRRAGLVPRTLTREEAEAFIPTLLGQKWLEVAAAQFDQSDMDRCVARMLRSGRARAKMRGTPFEIDADWVARRMLTCGGRCEVSGKPFDLTPARQGYRRPWIPSLDRISPKGGYTPGNTRLVCAAVNDARSDWPDEIFSEVVRAVYEARIAPGCLPAELTAAK